MKNAIKLKRAKDFYTGFKGTATVRAVMDQIPEELVDQLTGKQLALVMSAIDSAYQRGKSSTGSEMIDNNAVYINSINKIIEWSEVGAEYERITQQEGGATVTRSIKTKDGHLECRFSED